MTVSSIAKTRARQYANAFAVALGSELPKHILEDLATEVAAATQRAIDEFATIRKMAREEYERYLERKRAREAECDR